MEANGGNSPLRFASAGENFGKIIAGERDTFGRNGVADARQQVRFDSYAKLPQTLGRELCFIRRNDRIGLAVNQQGAGSGFRRQRLGRDARLWRPRDP